jgi:hypothetical protein
MAIAVKDQTGAPGWFTEDLHHCHFIPQFSPLVGHTWLLRHVLHRDDDLLSDAPWRRVAPGKVNLAPEWSTTRIDWWGLDWFWPEHPGSPTAPGWGAGVLVVLAATGASAALGLRRRLAAARAGLAVD